MSLRAISLDPFITGIAPSSHPFCLMLGLEFAVIFALSLSLTTAASAQSQLTVNFASNQGAVLHGASGWLYGQAESAVPSQLGERCGRADKRSSR